MEIILKVPTKLHFDQDQMEYLMGRDYKGAMVHSEMSRKVVWYCHIFSFVRRSQKSEVLYEILNF